MTTAAHLQSHGPASVATVRQLLLQELAPAATRLADSRALSRATVHDTRKRLKRARALLALLRPALNERDFIACDGAFRAAGKSLAATRDATVLARTCAWIVRQAPLASTTASLTAPLQAPGSGRVSATCPNVTHDQVRAGLARLERTRFVSRGWAALGPGLRAVYRRGRRCLRAIDPDQPSSDRLHAWRRHAKRYWHVLALFESVEPDALGPVVADLGRLSGLLGREHDLTLLAEHLRTHRSRRGREDAEVLRVIDQHRERLARRALKLGARIYAEPPRDVERRLERAWRDWRRATRSQRSLNTRRVTAA